MTPWRHMQNAADWPGSGVGSGVLGTSPYRRSGSGRRFLRMRLRGPLPAITEERLGGLASPWLRVALPDERRITLRQPLWVAARLEHDAAATRLEFALSVKLNV